MLEPQVGCVVSGSTTTPPRLRILTLLPGSTSLIALSQSYTFAVNVASKQASKQAVCFVRVYQNFLVCQKLEHLDNIVWIETYIDFF